MALQMATGESIDILRYLNILARYVWLILVCTLVALAISAFSSSRQPTVYQASSFVAMIKSQTRVTLDPNIKTLTETELGKDMFNLAARRNTFAALVNSSTIEAEVAQNLKDYLTSTERTPGSLAKNVRGSIKEGTDLIQITVTSDDPEKATTIANEWGAVYEKYINQAYGETTTNASIKSLEDQVRTTQKELDDRQKALTEFIQRNRASELTRLVEEKKQIINKVSESDINALADSYAAKRRLEQVLGDARALREQVTKAGNTGSSAANALALMLLKIQAYSSSANLPSTYSLVLPTTNAANPSIGLPNSTTLQVNLDSLSSLDTGTVQQLREVDTIVTVTESRIVQLEDVIKKLVNTLQSNSTKTQSLNEEVRELQAQLEETNAKNVQLTTARDLASQSYQSMSRKLTEAQLSAQLVGTEVRFASPAVVDTQPTDRNVLRSLVVSGIAGLLIGSIAALIIDYFKLWRLRYRHSPNE